MNSPVYIGISEFIIKINTLRPVLEWLHFWLQNGSNEVR